MIWFFLFCKSTNSPALFTIGLQGNHWNGSLNLRMNRLRPFKYLLLLNWVVILELIENQSKEYIFISFINYWIFCQMHNESLPQLKSFKVKKPLEIETNVTIFCLKFVWKSSNNGFHHILKVFISYKRLFWFQKVFDDSFNKWALKK